MNTMTQKQQDFILSLLDGREVHEDFIIELNAAWDELTVSNASSIIDTLKGMPYKKKSVSFVDSSSKGGSALADLPKSFYALSAHAANLVLKDEVVDNDYLFVVVAEYMGTRYMRKLSGNFGGFVRTKLSYRDARAIADLLSTEPLMFIQKFGELHSVCGKCGAELTDEKSRKFGFGPDCRKELGIK